MSGWSDAAFAASGALQYLINKQSTERIAEFDSESIYSYSLTRPLTALRGGQRITQWPKLTWEALPVPGGAHDLVLLVGPEPDLRWQGCLDAILDFAQKLGIVEVICLGAFLAAVHYAQPPVMLGISPDATLEQRLREMGLSDTNYEGATGLVAALVTEAAARGLPAASIWVAAPNYLGNLINPKLSSAMLAVVERLLGQDLGRGDLDRAAQNVKRRIDDILRSRPDLANYLQSLAGQQAGGRQFTPGAQEERSEPGELPSAEEVLKDLEEHLRRLRDRPPDQSDGTE
jgi:proteasome assembly chaperone (PAC2) family protein